MKRSTYLLGGNLKEGTDGHRQSRSTMRPLIITEMQTGKKDNPARNRTQEENEVHPCNKPQSLHS